MNRPMEDRRGIKSEIGIAHPHMFPVSKFICTYRELKATARTNILIINITKTIFFVSDIFVIKYGFNF